MEITVIACDITTHDKECILLPNEMITNVLIHKFLGIDRSLSFRFNLEIIKYFTIGKRACDMSRNYASRPYRIEVHRQRTRHKMKGFFFRCSNFTRVTAERP